MPSARGVNTSVTICTYVSLPPPSLVAPDPFAGSACGVLSNVMGLFCEALFAWSNQRKRPGGEGPSSGLPPPRPNVR